MGQGRKPCWRRSPARSWAFRTGHISLGVDTDVVRRFDDVVEPLDLSYGKAVQLAAQDIKRQLHTDRR